MGKGSKGGNPRADSMNPNNPAFAASQANRTVPLNPTSTTYKSSRGQSPSNTESSSEQNKE